MFRNLFSRANRYTWRPAITVNDGRTLCTLLSFSNS